MNSEEIKQALKEVIVSEVQLSIKPEEIGSDQPLFGEGLGLDSVEALAITAGIEGRFDVVIQDIDGIEKVFYSVDSLAVFVEELLAKK